MTAKEIVADELEHTCKTCKYEDELLRNYPCNECVCRDHWEHKKENGGINMDRQKYVNNQDYRDGYDEGVEDGREQIKKQIEYARNELEKILSFLKNIESENEK